MNENTLINAPSFKRLSSSFSLSDASATQAFEFKLQLAGLRLKTRATLMISFVWPVRAFSGSLNVRTTDDPLKTLTGNTKIDEAIAVPLASGTGSESALSGNGDVCPTHLPLSHTLARSYWHSHPHTVTFQ